MLTGGVTLVLYKGFFIYAATTNTTLTESATPGNAPE
jgi:hypothetical protein